MKQTTIIIRIMQIKTQDIKRINQIHHLIHNKKVKIS